MMTSQFFTLKCGIYLFVDVILPNKYNTMKTTKQFYIRGNDTDGVGPQYIEKAEVLLRGLRGFSHVTTKCIYAIDLVKGNIVFASDNMQIPFGIKPQDIISMGYDFYTQFIHKEDLQLLEELRAQTYRLLLAKPREERLGYTLKFNVRFLLRGKERLLQMCSVPLIWSDDGKLILLLCTLSPSSRKERGEIVLRRNYDDYYYCFDFRKRQWEKKNVPVLKDYERLVIEYTAQGFTAEEIADKMCKSLDTIKSYKRQLFRRLRFDNISEALMHSINHEMI